MKPYKTPYAKCSNNHALGKRAIKARRKCCFYGFTIHYGFYIACKKYGIIQISLHEFFKSLNDGSWFRGVAASRNPMVGGTYTIPITTPSHSVILNSLNEEKKKT